jgi:oxygen-dependent protoporphyrinogen oxidase
MAFRSAASEVQYEVGDVERLMVNENTSVYSFKDGMETLPLAMKAWLENQPNVQIVSDSTINSVKTREEDRTFEISVNSKVRSPAYIKRS